MAVTDELGIPSSNGVTVGRKMKDLFCQSFGRYVLEANVVQYYRNDNVMENDIINLVSRVLLFKCHLRGLQPSLFMNLLQT